MKAKELYKLEEVQALAVNIRRLVDQVKHLHAVLVSDDGKVESQEGRIVKDLEACGFIAEFGDVELPRKKTRRGLYIGVPKGEAKIKKKKTAA